MTLDIIILIVLVILSGFFSAAEVAFVSLSHAKVSAMVKKKLPQSRLIKKLKKNPRRLLITILIGNNLVNIAAASLATVVASDFFESAVIGITTGIMTLLILIFGEILPKSYAANHNKRFAIFSARFLQVIEIVGWPIIVIFEKMSHFFAGKPRPDKVSEEELKAMALTGKKQGTIEQAEASMLDKVFQLNDITADDIMTPRVQVVYLKDNMSIEEASDIIAKTPHTRFPVIHGSSDEIMGLVHSRDVLLAFNKDKEAVSIKKIIRPILKVPKQMKIDDLMHDFQKKKTHMAVVLDEYGGTEGIVTLEDVIEELVGEIVDEYDVEDNVIKRVNKDTIIVSGDTDLRDINEFLNVNIPGDPFDTIAEVILDKIKKIPRKNVMAEFDYIKCTITEVKNKTITRVKIVKTE